MSGVKMCTSYFLAASCHTNKHACCARESNQLETCVRQAVCAQHCTNLASRGTLTFVLQWLRSAATPTVLAISYSASSDTYGCIFSSRASGCPMPPAAPSSATFRPLFASVTYATRLARTALPREAPNGADGAIDRELSARALALGAAKHTRPDVPGRLAAHARRHGNVPVLRVPKACIEYCF